MSSENINNLKEFRVLREYYAELDDEAIDLLRQYYKVEESDDDKFLVFIKRNRSLTDNLLESRAD